MISRKIIAAAAVSALCAGTAGAATIDFTDRGVFSDPVVTQAEQPLVVSILGGGGSPTASITSSRGALNFSETNVGSTCASLGLACDQDGVGVINDEISAGQTITVTFSRALRVTELFFLDLFTNARGTERATVQAVGTDGGFLTFDAAESKGGVANRSGALEVVLASGGLRGITQLIFSAADTPGDDGTNDYALAGISVVPLPAGMILMLTALGGLGFFARRRRIAA